MFRRLFGSSNKQVSAQPVARAASATVESLESRQMLAAIQMPLLGIKIAKRVDGSGNALNSNRITIAFTSTVRIGDDSLFRSFGYANDLLNPGQQRKVTVGMTIERDPVDGRVLTIITDRLIRKGSRFFIYDGALTDTKGNTVVYDGTAANKTITFERGQNKPRFTLSQRNWAPTDLSYFTNDVFTGAPATSTANTEPNSTTVRNNLDAFLTSKVSQGLITAAQRVTALGIFDNPDNAPYVPSANLRAAIAALVGTVGEPAIASYLGKSNTTANRYTAITFDGTISASAPISETKLSSGGRLSLKIRPTYAGEDFRALSAVLAHEAIHQDLPGTQNGDGTPPNSQDEEIIANTVQSTVYIQQALASGGFVANSTNLVNKINEQVMAHLNSGRGLFPYGGIFKAPGLTNDGNVFPGAKTDPGGFGDNTPVESFEDWIRREYVDRGFSAGATAGNAVASAIITNIIGSGTNTTTLGTVVQNNLDTRNQVLTDVTYIKMGELLKLSY
jgi:hypothetical protein